MAVVPVGCLVIGENGGAVVGDQQTDYFEVLEVTGVLQGAAANPVLVYGVPGGVVCKGEGHGREVIIPDPAQEDSGCKVLGSDSGLERWPE